MGDWLVNFKGRNPSGPYNQNFLWKDKNIYIMDNHRAALWCWLQELEIKQKYNIFHIDRHYDNLNSRMPEWKKYVPDIKHISIDEYLNTSYQMEDWMPSRVPIFRFDNYLSLLYECYTNLIDESHYVTHEDGDKPEIKKLHEHKIWDLPTNFIHWCTSNENKWILNIDLDFFFCEKDGNEIQFISEEYISDFAKQIKHLLNNNKIAVITLCLSPEFCGGWKNSERILTVLCSIIEINFWIP